MRRPLPAPLDAATVLIFITNDCPISNAYAPEVNSIVHEFAPRGIRFFLVHIDNDLSLEQAQQHAKEYGFQCPVLMDPNHQLVAAVGATVTPQAAVIDAQRRLAYLGRIDDRYVDYGKKRAVPTQRDLRDALDAILAGRPVPHSRTRAIGCYIPDV